MMKPKTHDQMRDYVEERERYEHDLWGDRGSSRRRVAPCGHGATVEDEEHGGCRGALLGSNLR